MEAPVVNTKSDLDIRKDEMKLICKNILEKHLDGRKFTKDKAQKWGEFILNDTEEALKKNIQNMVLEYFFIYLKKLLIIVIQIQYFTLKQMQQLFKNIIQMIFFHI